MRHLSLKLQNRWTLPSELRNLTKSTSIFISKHSIKAYDGSFERVKNEFQRKQAAGNTTESDEIEFMRAKNVFRRQIAKVRDDLRREADDLRDDMEGGEHRHHLVQHGPSFEGVVTLAVEDPVQRATSGRPDGGHHSKNAETTSESAMVAGIQRFLEEGELVGLEDTNAQLQRGGAKRGRGRGRGGDSSTVGRGNKRAAKIRGMTENARAHRAPRGRKPKPLTKKQQAARQQQNNLCNTNLLVGQNLFRDIANNTARSQVGNTFKFNSARKTEALKELVASIPAEQQEIAKIDKKQLLDALSHFTPSGSVRADPGTDGWKMTGMKSTLSHYQMLGVSFMREREVAVNEPHGGLLADAMGLGKTVMLIANMVNGLRKNVHQTNLIVATSSLVNQWEQELKTHAEASHLGRVVRYHAGSRIKGVDVASTLENFNIIITTYDEVRMSYPKWKPPPELTTAEEKAYYWNQYYEEKKGPLHRIQFHRVILDEAQAIKTVDSQTSIACRALEAKYRWAASGTPVQNRLEEFYPYFRFLKVPHTGSMRVFKENYTGKTEAAERLHLVLRSFMLRRTHNDSLFGAKLLSLETPSKHEHICHFSDIERAIYDVLRRRFIVRINGFIRNDQVKNKYSNILTMILRLRQVVGHPLLVQDSLHDLLEPEDFTELLAICHRPVPAHMEQQFMIKHLRMMLQHDPVTLPVIEQLSSGGGRTPTEAPNNDSAPGPSHELAAEITINPNLPIELGETEASPVDVLGGINKETGSGSQDKQTSVNGSLSIGGSFGQRQNFAEFIGNLKDTCEIEDVQEVSPCTRCHLPPKNSHAASCGHLYCHECLQIMNRLAVEANKTQSECILCELPIHGSQRYVSLKHVKPSTTRGSPDLMGEDIKARLEPRKPKLKPRQIIDEWIDADGKMLPSAKTLAFKAQCLNWFQEDNQVKIIVYSQFISMIHILAKVCEMEGWGYVTFTGDDNIDGRDKKIEQFKKKEISIMLASLRTGGTGLNLTMASRVILIDLWWNTVNCPDSYISGHCYTDHLLHQSRPSKTRHFHARIAADKKSKRASPASLCRTPSTRRSWPCRRGRRLRLETSLITKCSPVKGRFLLWCPSILKH